MTNLNPLKAQAEWLLENANDSFKSLTEKEYAEHVDVSFRQVISLDALRMMGPQTAGLLPAKLEKFEKEQADQGVAILINDIGIRSRLSLAIKPSAPYLITSANVQPAFDLNPPAANSWKEFDEKWKAEAASVNFLVGEIIGDKVIPIHAINPDTRLALGSAFKLYILGTLAQQVVDGKATWDEKIALKEKLKSLPSGDMQNEKAGTEFTLQHYAEKMISISDNTGTDHCLMRAGRENVEKYQEVFGHNKPDVNIPFMSTRDLFLLKLGPLERAQEYTKSSEPGRRDILGILAKEKLPKVDASMIWDQPKMIDTLEWFASASEMGRLMLSLKELSEKPHAAKLLDILSINPGLPFDKYAWPFIGYKGGSEPGVLNMTWLLKRFDDRWFVLTGSLNDTEVAFNGAQTPGLMLAAAALLAKHKKTKR